MPISYQSCVSVLSFVSDIMVVRMKMLSGNACLSGKHMKRHRQITSANVRLFITLITYYSLLYFTYPPVPHLLLDGDLGFNPSAQDAYMKQKHRLIWERRYGKVGSGMTPKEE